MKTSCRMSGNSFLLRGLERRTGAWLFLPLVLVVLAACTPDNPGSSSLQVVDAWARAALGGTAPSAVYLEVVNPGQQSDRLVSASCSAAQAAELHQSMVMEGGEMQMGPVSGIDIPAGGKVKLEPGGFHIMLIGLSTTLQIGDTLPLTLVFERAGEVQVDVAVREP